MLKWSLCDYSDTYILVSRTITVAEVAVTAQKLKFSTFTEWILNGKLHFLFSEQVEGITI